jgi:hypothetical protein
MSALPTRTNMSDPHPAPNNATARAWHLAVYDFCAGLFGDTGTKEDARAALGVPNGGAVNHMVNPLFFHDQRNAGYNSLTDVFIPAGTFVRDMWYTGPAGCTMRWGAFVNGNTGPIISSGELRTKIYPDQLSSNDFHVLSWPSGALCSVDGGVTQSSPVVISIGTAPIELTFTAGGIGNPQLEKGIVPTEFSALPRDLELLRCKRYYRKGQVIQVVGANNTLALNYQPFDLEMADTPTVTFTDAVGNASKISVNGVNNLAVSGGGVSGTKNGITTNIAPAAAMSNYWVVNWVATI